LDVPVAGREQKRRRPSNPRIASELFISPKTASVHVSNIMSRLGVSSRGEAAAAAYQPRLLDTP
jgi:DNA-binding NarL/FixJ family response regulator